MVVTQDPEEYSREATAMVERCSLLNGKGSGMSGESHMKEELKPPKLRWRSPFQDSQST